MQNAISGALVGLLLILTGMITGCATMMNSDTVGVPVYTTPPGAILRVAGKTYISPATVKVPRGQGNFVLTIEKDGYDPIEMTLSESADGWLWGNILTGGPIGLGVDLVTRDAYDISPETVDVALSKPDPAGRVRKNGKVLSFLDIIRHYHAKAEQGNADAQYKLGLMYSEGIGMKRNYVRAHVWLSLAAAKGHQFARLHRESLDTQMSIGEISQAERLAREWKSKKRR